MGPHAVSSSSLLPPFERYDLHGAFDEMFTPDGEPRDHYRVLAARLREIPIRELQRHQQAADRAFLTQGITFTVYGDGQGTERIFPYDLLPRIVPSGEWEHLERGLQQRIHALNLFLRDIYHVMGVALQVWMFLTPIFYPARKVVEAKMGWVLQVNPMYWLIDSYRNALLYGMWPKVMAVTSFGAVALLVFVLGSTFFLRQKPRFPDLL